MPPRVRPGESEHEDIETSSCCCLTLCRDGVLHPPVHGAILMSDAAARGSKNACFNLGLAYADGLWGCPKDEKMARRYYSMVASAAINDCTDAGKEQAATWLREHPAA